MWTKPKRWNFSKTLIGLRSLCELPARVFYSVDRLSWLYIVVSLLASTTVTVQLARLGLEDIWAKTVGVSLFNRCKTAAPQTRTRLIFWNLFFQIFLSRSFFYEQGKHIVSFSSADCGLKKT